MPTGVPKKKIEIFGLSKTDTRRGRIIKEVIEEIIPEFNVEIHIGTEKRKGSY